MAPSPRPPRPALAPARRLALLLRRLLALAYDLCLLAGLAFAAALPVVWLAGGPPRGAAMLGLQIWLLLVCGGYVSLAWHRSGMTLGMQAWDIEVRDSGGRHPSPARAALRFLAAVLCIAPGGLGLWWSLFDREGRGLHDHLSGTRVERRRRG
jgi:uncharacterized RDD family membrane protein YckC